MVGRSRWSGMVAPVILCALVGCASDTGVEPADEGDSSDEALSTAPSAASPAPLDRTRFLTCPVKNTAESNVAKFRGKNYTYKTDQEVGFRSAGWEGRATVDDRALDGLVPGTDRALVIDIRRVNGKPAYAYFGAHGKIHETYEPWSSAKFMAASAAMARVRAVSQSKVGGPSNVAVGPASPARTSALRGGGQPRDGDGKLCDGWRHSWSVERNRRVLSDRGRCRADERPLRGQLAGAVRGRKWVSHLVFPGQDEQRVGCCALHCRKYVDHAERSECFGGARHQNGCR